MRRLLEYGGYGAAVVLVAFGIGALVLSINGKSTVKDSLSQEKIVGSADMTPDAIAAEAQEAGLSGVDLPSCSVAGEQVDTGSEARCFASYMRIHALEASGGKTYAEMPRFATEDGKGTNDPAQAQKDANGQPVSNGARDLWVTETALATALNTSYMADQLGNFGIVVGIALILAGIGFAVLAWTALHTRARPQAANWRPRTETRRATRRRGEPPSDAEIERGLRERAVTSARDAEVLLRWLQRPRAEERVGGVNLDSMSERELERLYAGLLKLAALPEEHLHSLLTSVLADEVDA